MASRRDRPAAAARDRRRRGRPLHWLGCGRPGFGRPGFGRPGFGRPGFGALALLAALLLSGLPPARLAAERPGGAAQLVQAPAPVVGVVNAASFEPLDRALPVTVQPLDDTDLNLQIRDQILAELRQGAYRVSDPAALELSFDSSVEQGRIPARELSLGHLDAGSEKDAQSGTGVDVEVNVWSSSQDSVLGGRKEAEGKRKVSQFHINAELRSLRDGTLIWRGDVFADMDLSGPEQLSGQLVLPLVASLGRTVRNQPFGAR